MPKVKLTYKDGKWYRNGKRFTDYVLNRYKYYDAKSRAYRKLNSDGTTVLYTPYLDKLRDQAYEEYGKKVLLKSKQTFSPSKKIITLKTKGRMNLADVPVNMLDSIAVNTGRSNTDIKTNLGLVGKESTFTGYSKALGKPFPSAKIDPYQMVNNHAYYNNPAYDYEAAIDRKLYNNKKSIQSYMDAEKNVKYAYEHGLIKPQTKQYHDNMLADAFARYADNPNKYNPGQGNYIKMVTNIGNEVWDDPQIQNWWNTEGVKHYNKGLKERFK